MYGIENLPAAGLFDNNVNPWLNDTYPDRIGSHLPGADSELYSELAVRWDLSSKYQNKRGKKHRPTFDSYSKSSSALLSVKRDVVVAIVDSGVDLSNAFINSFLWQNVDDPIDGIDNDGNGLIDDVTGWNFVANNPVVSDHLGHGTQIAGLVAKVAGSARIMPLKVIDNSAGSAQNIARAINYSIEKNVDIINLSMNSSQQSSDVDDAISRAIQSGIPVVVSAGNNGLPEPEYPASLPGVIAAGELSSSGRLQPWSSGPGSGVARYVSTRISGMKTTYLNGETISALGTSCAAAKISGILAYLRARGYEPSVSRLKSLASSPGARRS